MEMPNSTNNLVLHPDDSIDLQLHTVNSDGAWKPSNLIDHVKLAGFALIAITDHDRVDTIGDIQQLAIEKSMPTLIAVEMTTRWRGGIVDILCYGFNSRQSALTELAKAILKKQQTITSQAFNQLYEQGHLPLDDAEAILTNILATPVAQQSNEIYNLLEAQELSTDKSSGLLMKEAGFSLATNDTAEVIDAGHRDCGVCLIAHPGRTDGFTTFDSELLDQFRAEIPIDGIEVYYPKHSPEQIEAFLEYAKTHDLFISSGSDSHYPDTPPIPYRAEQSRKLLERLGIRFQ